MRKKIAVLTGAGMSAESGISTFRDTDGLWENHDIMQVASPEGWKKNPKLVLDFYNQRRAQLKKVQPNKGHLILAQLENHHEIHIITQNVDDLHERAGSTKIIHLHGELKKVQSLTNPSIILPWENDLTLTDTDSNGNPLRPHIVWFGEEVPNLNLAIPIVQQADVVVIIGTSLKVYPAAGLMRYAKPNTPLYYIDPKPAPIPELDLPIKVIPMKASDGIEEFKKFL